MYITVKFETAPKEIHNLDNVVYHGVKGSDSMSDKDVLVLLKMGYSANEILPILTHAGVEYKGKLKIYK